LGHAAAAAAGPAHPRCPLSPRAGPPVLALHLSDVARRGRATVADTRAPRGPSLSSSRPLPSSSRTVAGERRPALVPAAVVLERSGRGAGWTYRSPAHPHVLVARAGVRCGDRTTGGGGRRLRRRWASGYGGGEEGKSLGRASPWFGGCSRGERGWREALACSNSSRGPRRLWRQNEKSSFRRAVRESGEEEETAGKRRGCSGGLGLGYK
jgi:hypothetical protein